MFWAQLRKLEPWFRSCCGIVALGADVLMGRTRAYGQTRRRPLVTFGGIRRGGAGAGKMLFVVILFFHSV